MSSSGPLERLLQNATQKAATLPSAAARRRDFGLLRLLKVPEKPLSPRPQI